MNISTQAKKGFLAGAVLLLVGVVAYALIFGTKGTPSSVGVRQEVDGGGQKSPKAEPSVSGAGVKGKSEAPVKEAKDQGALLKEALAALEDPGADTGALIKAIVSLREVYSREAVELLIKFLAFEEEAVVAEAIDTLGVIGLNSDQKDYVLKVLLEKASDKEFLLRGPALLTAAMMGEPGRTLPVIAKYISEEGDGGKDFAVRAMAFIATPECVPLVRELLEKTKDWEILRDTYVLLTKIDSPEAVQLLREGLYAEDGDKQLQSAWALSRGLNEKHSASLIEAVSAGGLAKDAMAVIARSPAAPEVFGSALSNEALEKNYRLQLFDVLASNTLSAPGKVRNSVAEMLQPFLNSSDSAVEVAALKALAKAGASTDQTPVIAPKLESKDFLVQGAALQAFVQYCTPQTYSPLKTLWYDDDEQIRRTAFFFSEPFLSTKDLPDLEKATTHEDEFIKKHSQVMIKYLTPKHGK